MFSYLLKLQSDHPRLILFSFLILVVLSSIVASELKIDPSFSSLVPQDSQFNTNDRILNNAFNSNDAFLLLIEVDESSQLSKRPLFLNDSYTLDYIDKLTTTLNQSQYITSISQPIFSDDNKNAEIFLSLYVPNNVEGFSSSLDELNYLLSEVGEPPGVSTTLTGLPVLLNRVTTLLVTDNMKTIVITLVAIFFFLFYYFRNIRLTLICLATPISTLILLAALMVALGINITITLAAVGVLILGLGVDYAIHFAIHFESDLSKGMSRKEALFSTSNDLEIAILASFLTTLAGFTALILGVSPSSQAQGMVLSIGIILIYLMTVIITPVLLILFAPKKASPAPLIFKKIKDLLSKVSIFQAHHPKSMIGVVLILTVFFMIGASQVEFSTSNSNWIPDGDPVSETFSDIVYTFGSSESLSIILTSNKGDLRNSQTVKDIKILEEKLRGVEGIDSVFSPFTETTLNSEEIYDAALKNKDSFNKDYTLTRISILSENLGVDESGNTKALKEVRDIVSHTPVYNADAVIHGDAVRFEELGENLQRDTGVTTVLGLILVFFLASLIYTSFVVGVIALVPIILAVIWAVGLMGFFGVPFNSLSTGIISLVIGAGVDFSIHLLDSTNRYKKEGYDLDHSLKETMVTSGSALLLSTTTTFIGFASLVFATLLGTQRLGWSLSFAILSTFLATILLVPAIISIRESRFKKNIKGKRRRKR